MIAATVLLILAAILFVAWLIISRYKHPNAKIVVQVRRHNAAEVYHYFFPGKSVPSAAYERGSYRINLIASVENTPAMPCCGHPELTIRGKEELKLLAGALTHICKMESINTK